MRKKNFLKLYILFFFLITKSISSWAVPWNDFKKIFHLHGNISNTKDNLERNDLTEDKKTKDKKTKDKKTKDEKIKDEKIKDEKTKDEKIKDENTEDEKIIDSTYEYTLYYDSKMNFIPVERINPPVTYLVQKELENLKSDKDKMILLNENKNKISGRMIYDEKKDKVKIKKNKKRKYGLF